MFEKDEEDVEDSTDLDHSLTESEEVDINQRRYTRNQKQMIGAKMASSMSPQKNQGKSTPQHSRPGISQKIQEKSTPQPGKSQRSQENSTPQRASTRSPPKSKEVSPRRHSPRSSTSQPATKLLPLQREISNSPRRASSRQSQASQSSPERRSIPIKTKQSTPLKVKRKEDINIANSMSVPVKNKTVSKVNNEALLNTSMDTALEKAMKPSPMPKKRTREDSQIEIDAKKPKTEVKGRDTPDAMAGFVQLDIAVNVPSPSSGEWKSYHATSCFE